MVPIVAFLIGMVELSAGQPTANLDPLKARGTVVPSVICLAAPTQSYALYLPSHYSPERRWPIIYAFDPFARGKVAVELYKEAAEKFGYIVAGSNNARNGPGSLEMAAAQAVWQDTHRRFTIDKDRVYTTGLSGGARFATSFALYCYTCAIAGVISHGAGYPVKEALPANDHFVYYVAVGDADFNYPEIIALRAKKEKEGAAFKVKIYPGPHQWAPPDVVEDAVEWLELKAMQAGKEKSDPALIQRMFAKIQAEATQAKQSGDVMGQYYSLYSLTSDFKGLEDTRAFEAELAMMKKSKSFERARHEENKDIERQQSLTTSAGSDIAELGKVAPEQVPILKERLLSVFSDLRRQSKSNKPDHMVYLRAFNQLWVQGMEDGQEEFRRNDLVQAAAYFDLMSDAAPDQSWPMLLLAETRVRAGDRKAALKALQEAVKRGVKSPEMLTQDPELAPLSKDPAFQELVRAVAGSKDPS